MTKILHYLNQFFAGIGGEDKAGQEFLFLPSGGAGYCAPRFTQNSRGRLYNGGLRRQLLSRTKKPFSPL